jgi:hypothetical protein
MVDTRQQRCYSIRQALLRARGIQRGVWTVMFQIGIRTVHHYHIGVTPIV